MPDVAIVAAVSSGRLENKLWKDLNPSRIGSLKSAGAIVAVQGAAIAAA